MMFDGILRPLDVWDTKNARRRLLRASFSQETSQCPRPQRLVAYTTIRKQQLSDHGNHNCCTRICNLLCMGWAGGLVNYLELEL